MSKPSLQLLQILALLIEDPNRKFYGLEIIQETGVQAGSLYPILAGLEKKGLVVSEWEDINEQEAKRRRRRYYQITLRGVKYAEAELNSALRPIAKRIGWVS